jgi:hypothetical protein
MTELSPPDESAAAQPSPDWPQDSQPEVTDQLVHQALAPLKSLPAVPVAEHEAVYNALHDELRAALDSDPSDGGPSNTDPSNTDPSDGGA